MSSPGLRVLSFVESITFNGDGGCWYKTLWQPPILPSPLSPLLPCLTFPSSAYSCLVLRSSLLGGGRNPLCHIHRVQRAIQSWGMSWISSRTSPSGKPSPRWPIVTVRFQVITFRGNFRNCLPKGTDILYLRLMGDDMVVLSSDQAISDLVEKRSAIYADRVSGPLIFTFRS